MAPSEEDCLELLECARYGEEDELQQQLLLGVPVDYADDGGNTALHKAAANGHLGVVKALLRAGAKHIPNASGNTPLHWAVQQSQREVARALLQHFTDIDVLAQNDFGRSVSTEAFAKDDVQLVELVLAHPSANKLEPKQQQGDSAGASLAAAEVSADVTHGFQFGAGTPTVHVRELAQLGSDDVSRVLGASPEEDCTGLQLWSASIILSHWLLELRAQISGQAVIELGAGCGLCGIVAARLCGCPSVLLTDLAPRTVENLRHNLHLNELSAPTASAEVLDWREPATWPAPQPVVIGSDLVYADEMVPHLLRVVQALVAPGGCFLYVALESNRQGEADFLHGLCAAGLECQVSNVPEVYLRNTLAERTDEEFELFFSELRKQQYRLYYFSSCVRGDELGTARQ